MIKFDETFVSTGEIILKKQRKPRWGYKIINCPICKSKTFEYCSYSEYGWGIVEQHGNCNRCGYLIEQAYSPSCDCFWDVKKGFKDRFGKYYSKNVKKHKRIRRKLGIKRTDYDINPEWIHYI